MIDFIRTNADWLIPIVVAVITGVFGIFVVSRNKSRLKVKNTKNSTVIQLNQQGSKNQSTS